MLKIIKVALIISKKDFLKVFIISIGVLAGLLLLKQSQDFREKAQTESNRLYTICHKTGNPDSPWEEIEIGEDEIYYHLSHGDRVGQCRFNSEPTATPTFYYLTPTVLISTITPTINIIRPTPTQIIVPTSKPTPVPTLVPTPMATEKESERVPQETERVQPGSLASVNFSVRFQSVNSKRPDQSVRIEMHPEAGENQIFEAVNVEADSIGVYSGAATNVKPGVYDIYVKGASHLQRKISGVYVYKGVNEYDWTDRELLVGDFDGNNVINLYDLALIIQYYKKEDNIITELSLNYDVNFDGLISLGDIDEVLGNYLSLEVSGDEKS